MGNTQLQSGSHGVFAINKPLGITSHDVISQVRRITGEKRVGHAGTLDPLASGVLIVAVGREYTKQLDTLMTGEKEYIAEVRLGMMSTTDDEEGEKIEHDFELIPTREQIEQILQEWVGKKDQIPPIYSAIKIKGMPAHRRVRKGQDVELAARPIQIFSIEIKDYQWPVLKIKVVCGKGVYIRSLARDIGKELGVGGYLKSLIRTRVGDYKLEESIVLSSFP